MGEARQPDISALLAAWGSGEDAALNDLITAVYPDLRRLARQHLAYHAADHSLESAAVVNEVYLKLMSAGGVQCENRVRFLALCAQVVRWILVDDARRRSYAKRGGGAARIPLDESVHGARTPDAGILALNDALEALAHIDPRKCRVVELRYFGGLTVAETAEALGISPETATRDWRMAKSWLFREQAGPNSETLPSI